MIKKLSLIPVVAAAALLAPSASVQARGHNDLSDYAHRIEHVGREIKNEFQTHYKRSSAYRHLMADINEILVKAEHIDQLSHDPYTSYRHIKTDLEELDRLAHHLHDVVDAVEKGRYRGYVDGGLAHVHHKMDALNDSIHRMERAVVAYSRPPRHDYHSHRSANNKRIVTPSYRSSRPEDDFSRILRSIFGGFNPPASRSHGHSH